ncbi:DEAD/DEAH box helicase [Streptomyces sp. AC627_RSS907]|uniref:DEAD/DEAH box helicase n=1 Tax=Streptomyces sp. AC627_RSS907 TaxID=2823684 RepID=UPI0027E57D85|nr:DEAD/DEAH box helicase [Streptomyces sp. AC627_RSS907]
MFDPVWWEDLRGCTAVFLPGDPPRSGRIAFHAEGGRLPAGAPAEELLVVLPHGRGGRRRTVPAVVCPLADVLPLLLDELPERLTATGAAWRHAALYALYMAGRGLLLPGLSPDGYDAWRLGPFSQEDADWVRALAGSLAPSAYATPLERAGRGRTPLLLPHPYDRLRLFLDAVADLLPRTPAAATAAGQAAFAGRDPRHLPGLWGWTAKVADGRDAGVQLSLRLELPDTEGYFESADDGTGAGAADRPGAAVRCVPQVRSLADPLLRADLAGVRGGTVEGFGPRDRARVESTLRAAAEVWPALAGLLEPAGPDVLGLDDDAFLTLLDDGIGALARVGVAVHLPKDLVRDLVVQAVLEPGSGSPDEEPEGSGFFTPEALLSFRWELAVGDRTLTPAELDRLAQAGRPLVRLRDHWVVVDEALVRKARSRPREVDALEALTAVLTGEVAGDDGTATPVRPNGWLASLHDRLTAPEHAADAELLPPAGLEATLRGYQLRGLAWLDRLTSLGLGACLADDMGLGKTITTIALHLRRQEEPRTACGPTLVVCPVSLLGNWGREIDRFAPGTPWRRHHGPARDLGDLRPDEIVLTTYGTLRRDLSDLCEAGPWGLVVADEAQHAKNPASVTAKAMRALPAQARVALSGTPVENNLTELWSLLDWATPGLLGPLTAFRDRYGRAAERAARGSEDEADAAAAGRLGRLIRPFVLRRRKSDPGIAPELPPKTETDHPVRLTREQTVLYEAQVRESMDEIRNAQGITRHALVLKLLTALKQICNHPGHYLKEETAARLTGRSGKLELLDELIDVLLAENESVLVFTQYTRMARMLEAHLARRGVRTLLLHGGTPVHRREEMVDAFQRGEVPVFLLSLRAAGTGLNLTRASHVVHYDRWWNPAVEDQATDRAYRIGQTQPVQVHRLITEGTVEERIARLISSKRDLADSVLGGNRGEAAISELTDDELADLVALHTTTDRSSR